MKSPLLLLPGAVPSEWPDEGVAAHYGDPMREQRVLGGAGAPGASGNGAFGIVDRSHRGVVRIGGADRLTWLHSLTTQHLESLPAGTTAQALILRPTGHVEHQMTLIDDATQVWAHTEPGTAPALVGFLESMRFMMRVEPADVTAGHAVLTVAGPGAQDAAAEVRDMTVAATMGPFGMDLLVPREQLADAAARLRGLGGEMAGMWAFEGLRIAARVPRLGVDTDHRTIPHEVGWIETAVHLEKGCYRGQETVARVHNLGHPPRRLVFLHLDGSADRLPEPGSAVRLAGDPDHAAVGRTGSAARHYELGPIGLALVKRTVPVDATLNADGIAAAQEVIVPPDAGANVLVNLRRGKGGLPGLARRPG
jgi:tRNA-modifying protein YgfZ